MIIVTSCLTVTPKIKTNRSVRLGKVVYSSGCKPRSSKTGQPLGRKLWGGVGNRKDQAQSE
jgi:hypothetical protein